MAKLSRTLQTKHLDLSLISSLVDATHKSPVFSKLGFTATRYKRRVKKPQQVLKSLKINGLFKKMGKPFIRLVKDNISSWFRSSSKDVLSAFSIFDPKKVPSLSTHDLYMETVQFKLSLDSLGEIYQLNHWKQLNLRRKPLSLLTTALSGKCIVSSLLSSLKMIYLCN